MPNMPHLFAKHEVVRCSGDVAPASGNTGTEIALAARRMVSQDCEGAWPHHPHSCKRPDEQKLSDAALKILGK
jgi:hypothetical protein